MHLYFWTSWTSITYIRASGLVAWYLLNLEVMAGVMASSGVGRLVGSIPLKLLVHKRVLSWALVVALAVHVGVILSSRYQGWGADMVTEMGFGTLARNMGVLAIYLLLIVGLAGAVRRSLPPRLWTVLHRWLPLLVVVAATIHGLGAGTDSQDAQIMGPGIATLTVLVTIFVARKYAAHARVLKARGRRRLQRRQYRLGRPNGLHYRTRK